MSSGALTVGFLSLTEKEDASNKRTSEVKRDDLHTSTHLEPQLSHRGYLQKKNSTGGWKTFWCVVNLEGVLVLQKNPDSKQVRKKFKLRDCTIAKRPGQDNCFVIQEGRTTRSFRTTEGNANLWIHTLSVS